MTLLKMPIYVSGGKEEGEEKDNMDKERNRTELIDDYCLVFW